MCYLSAFLVSLKKIAGPGSGAVSLWYGTLRIRGSGYVTKRHESETLVKRVFSLENVTEEALVAK